MDMQKSSPTSAGENAKRGHTPARVYLSADGRQLLHVLPDGTTTARPLSFYKALLERTSARDRAEFVSLLASPDARRVATMIVTWLVRVIVLAWLALHAGTACSIARYFGRIFAQSPGPIFSRSASTDARSLSRRASAATDR